MQLGIIDLICTALTVITGALLKKVSWYNTKFVPLASVALAAAIRILASLGVGVPQAADGVALASIFAISFPGLGQWLLHVLVDTLIATGAHSWPKNIIQGLRARA